MKKKTKLIIAVPVIIVLALLVSVSSIYHKGPWRGKVIDSETGEPIEGAAVVAVWNYKSIGPTGGGHSFLDGAETMTNKDGEFVMPARWYISIPLIREVGDPLTGPWFTIFKPGYGSYPRYQVSPTHLSETLFEAKGTVVELSKLNTKKERLDSAAGAHTPASWSKTPILLRLINQERCAFGLEPVGPAEVTR